MQQKKLAILNELHTHTMHRNPHGDKWNDEMRVEKKELHAKLKPCNT